MGDLTALFAQGEDDYWAGMVPDGWDDDEQRACSPYLTGWYMASMDDNDPEWLNERDQ